MKFQKDILVIWDISEKDHPTIVITSLEYDPKAKHVVAETLCNIYGFEANGGCISINQLIAKHYLYKSDKAKEEAEKALAAIKALRKCDFFKQAREATSHPETQNYIHISIDELNDICDGAASVKEAKELLIERMQKMQEGE